MSVSQPTAWAGKQAGARRRAKTKGRFRTRALMLAWAPHSGGAEGIAERLGIGNHFVHCLALQRPWITPIKYPLQTMATLRLLFRERPAVVIVQVPPIVAPLVTDVYARLTGARFIINSHSLSFMIRRWSWAESIEKWLARRALADITTSDHLAEVIRSWGARPIVVVNPPNAPPALGPRQPSDKCTVMVVNTFSEDEPTDEVLQAARELPDVHFAITGDTSYARPEWLSNAPPNVEWTGFLRGKAYYERLWNANVVLVLTTRDYAMQHSALEAMDLRQPLVLSDWPFLKGYFSRGTVHVGNDAVSIAAGVRTARAQEDDLRTEMGALREQRARDWQDQLAELDRLIDSVWLARSD